MTRVRHLGRLTPHGAEAAIAIAIAAIEAREWLEARKALEPLLGPHLTQRVCTLMARIEGEQHGNAGAVREWLARAVNAPRDPAWTADSIVSDDWAPTSPVTGALDAFRWRVPVEVIDAPGGALLAAKDEALVGLGAATEPRLAPSAAPVVAAGAEVIEGSRREDRPISLTAAHLPAPQPRTKACRCRPSPCRRLRHRRGSAQRVCPFARVPRALAARGPLPNPRFLCRPARRMIPAQVPQRRTRRR